mmetsp:Transcript_3917/g.10261  ORF Transcript_3917/g.10261 Transcript_3917/m.10261 type:complete len:93 (+) Transcript_3917:1068-1346(+)
MQHAKLAFLRQRTCKNPQEKKVLSLRLSSFKEQRCTCMLGGLSPNIYICYICACVCVTGDIHVYLYVMPSDNTGAAKMTKKNFKDFLVYKTN